VALVALPAVLKVALPVVLKAALPVDLPVVLPVALLVDSRAELPVVFKAAVLPVDFKVEVNEEVNEEGSVRQRNLNR